MQIKDVHVIVHVLVTWFIQRSGKYFCKEVTSFKLDRAQYMCICNVL